MALCDYSDRLRVCNGHSENESRLWAEDQQQEDVVQDMDPPCQQGSQTSVESRLSALAGRSSAVLMNAGRTTQPCPCRTSSRIFPSYDWFLCGVKLVCIVVVFSVGSIRKSSSLATVVSLLLLACCVAPQNSPSTYKPQPPKVCESIEIRDGFTHFDAVNGCEVIEGNLQILLLQDTYILSNLSFPKLREVTGYIVLWRVSGLLSLGVLFPNLSVIRGRSLVEDYAFVVYEMPDLMEIGLRSLTNITRGSVHIAKNKRLCYVDTIDWNAIAPNAVAPPLYSENRPKNECGRCQLTTSEDCITSPDLRCWSKELCQKKSYDCLGSDRSADRQCCHERCLGGCSGSTSKDCHSCKEVFLDGECIQECPPNTYKYLDRRCVTRDECQNFPYPRELTTQAKKYPFRLVEGSCLLECPANYTEESYTQNGRTYYRCKPCEGACSKECNGAIIESIMAAQTLTGCTHITGPLEIHLRHGGIMNLAKELEKSLGSIEVIDGYLKVVRSFSLISLNFLKNLRVIHGNRLDNRNASFVILDNENLQELWDWEKRPKQFTITQGKLFVHKNPKLCYYKLERFREIAQLDPFTEQEVPRDSNGDKEACNITEIHVDIARIQPFSVIIVWKEFEINDPRKLLGYVVSYVRAPFQNVTQYDGRDACGNDGWSVDDVPMNMDASDMHSIILSPLQPFTQYAFFVKTVMVKTETNGGQSKIQYVTTAPATPTMPNAVQAWAESGSEIFISWQKPTRANGNLSHYIVLGNYEEDIVPEKHDYCGDPIIIKMDQPHRNIEPPPPTITPLPDHKKCQCGPGDTERDTEEDRQKKISFEDALQNYFFIKNVPPTDPGGEKNLSKREVERGYHGRDLNALNGETSKVLSSRPGDDRYQLNFNISVYNGTSLVVKNLKYFARYSLSVQACRAVSEKTEALDDYDKRFPECSVTRIVSVRTKKNETADSIVDFRVEHREVNDTTKTRLLWKEPRDPNGVVHSYKINGTRFFGDKEMKINWCTGRHQYSDGWVAYDASNLEPGNYSFNVRAVSLGGEGPLSRTVWVYVRPGSASATDAWIGVFLAILLIFIIVTGLAVYWRRINPSAPKLFPNVNPEYISASSVYIADDWEVSREKIELIRELGKGSFGMVYEGLAKGIVEGEAQTKCAVKIVNEEANNRERHEFLNEASVMKAFHTHHVVRLLGVVSIGEPTLVVMELMSNGDLKTYLRNHRPDVDGEVLAPPTLKRILLMAIQIADGMAYLAANKFVHRDLAARNCMVAEDLTVKIGDFGMTRDIYETDYYKKGSKGFLPVRWMAHESIKDGVFTSSSDVWSYGVVLWEMVTLASQPYLGLTNEQVIRYILDGGIMERPENCPDKLYELMLACWCHKPSLRLSFMDIVTRLLPDANEAFQTNSFYFSPEGREVRALKLEAMAVDLEASYGSQRTPLRATAELDDEDFTSVCSGSDGEDAGNIPLTTVRTPSQPPVISSSDSSRGSKISNGSGPVNGIISKMTPC